MLRYTPRFTRSDVAIAAAVVTSVLLASAPSLAAPPERSAEGPWAKGRILVMPKAGLSASDLGKIAGAHGAKAQRITSHGLHVFQLPGNASETAVLNRLARNPHLKFAELDRQVSEDLTPNDPYFGSQWHLSKVGAPAAWGASQGSGVTIAILDSGVDPTHPDLKDRLVPGYNFVDGNTNTSDVRGHGTWVAGAAAAALNNSVGVAGLAGQARIMPVRVSDSTGYVYWSTMAQALTYAADKGARIANMSFNGVAGSSSVLSAANYMKSKGGLSFVSAGNSGTDPGYADTDAMIIVSATDSNDSKTSWSNFGDHVDLSAPGAGIYSTANGGGYQSVNGTSFSAPIAAATAALAMSANPSLSNTQIEQVLISTAVDLGATGKDNSFGHGRINADAAVQGALAAVSTVDTKPPTVAISAPLGSSTVSGLVPVSVMATDNKAVVKVELRVNGALFAADTSAPFGFSWDSTKTANGINALVARACDAANNCADSVPVAVNVANTVAPAPAAPSPAALALSGSTARVTWANVANETGYQIRTEKLNSRKGTWSASTVSVGPDVTTYTTSLSSGTYRMSVRALGASGNSSYVLAGCDGCGSGDSFTIGATKSPKGKGNGDSARGR